MSIRANCQAVDRAIATLCTFVDAHPQGQTVVERRRWRKRKSSPTDPVSSWAYFLARYGSLTWVTDLELERVPTFLPGNVTGPSGLLVLGDRWDVADILGPLLESKRLRGHGLDTAIVFHGGWGQAGYAFDTRVTSPDGEHPIYRFSVDEPLPGFPHERDLAKVKPSKIVPFGVWLEREVTKLVAAVARELRPRKPARAANAAVAFVTPRGLPGAELGATYKGALATFGKPSAETKTGQRLTAVWRSRGLVIQIDKGAIQKLTLWYSERWFRHNAMITSAVGLAPWRTDQGIGSGATLTETRKAYGKAPHTGGYKDATGRHDWLVYETIGFHFFKGTLARIDVFRP